MQVIMLMTYTGEHNGVQCKGDGEGDSKGDGEKKSTGTVLGTTVKADATA